MAALRGGLFVYTNIKGYVNMSSKITLRIKYKHMRKEEQILFKINGVDSVKLSNYIASIEQFADVIRESALVAGYGEANVKIKPIKKGSIETELVIGTLDFFGSQRMSGAVNIASIITAAYGVIIFTKGIVNRFRKDSKTVTYLSEGGEEKTVPYVVHQTVQNPIVQIGIVNSIDSSIGRVGDITSITVGGVDNTNDVTIINRDDCSSFSKYKETPLEEDYEETTSKMSGLYVNPVRGSYSGENTRYTFRNGQAKYYPTTIKDEDFRESLKSGDVKLFSEDLLRVDMTAVQRFMPTTQRTVTEYFIDRVHDYIPRSRPQQSKLDI